MKTLITNIAQLATMAGVVEKDGIGVTWDDLGLVENASLLIEDDKILSAGPADDFDPDDSIDKKLDAAGAVAIPGLIDPHTHPCWVGLRHDEFAMRAEGKSYLEISTAGGGIRASMRHTRQASLEELAQACNANLARMLSLGVTCVEAKSGYALNTDGELRTLRAIKQAGQDTDQIVIATFLGAHAIPPEFENNSAGYTNLVINEMLPAVAREELASFCDVFVEAGFFSIDQGRRILSAAADLGMGLRLHADEFESLGGAQLAAEMGAASADHLMAIDQDGIRALAEADVTAVLLPATTLFLGQSAYAPARRLLDAGCRVALSTDFNPGSSHTENQQLVFTLACTCLHMSVPEALAAVTYNAARSLLLHEKTGALLPGRRADVALFSVPDLRAIPYHLAMSDLQYVIAGGQLYQAPGRFAVSK